MFVYSGKCRICDCGIPTGKVDQTGKSLFTGDIAISFAKDEGGFCGLGSLTVVVLDQYQTYTDGDSDEWGILKVKSYKDVIEHESWKEYGFNYKTT
jgi:hypothetical protein